MRDLTNPINIIPDDILIEIFESVELLSEPVITSVS